MTESPEQIPLRQDIMWDDHIEVTPSQEDPRRLTITITSIPRGYDARKDFDTTVQRWEIEAENALNLSNILAAAANNIR